MSWQDLKAFRNPAVPKLDNLRRAQACGFKVPTPTVWIPAAQAVENLAPPPSISFPLILRSGSPTEDTLDSSQAGRFASLLARTPEEFPEVLASVVGSLPEQDGVRQGVVFAQPWIEAE